MARPTDSRIIYLQQLGRALSSDTSREKTIVFDLVNNYLKNNLDAEINKRTNENHRGNDDIDVGHEDGPQDEIEDIDIFRIQGETRDFLDLLDEVQGIIDRSSYLTNARAIKKWIEKSGDIKPPNSKSKDEKEKRLGMALANLRRNLIKPYLILQTEEEKEKFRNEHPEIDEVLEIVNEIDENNIHPYIKNARDIREWIYKSGDTKLPSKKSNNEEEKRLRTAWDTLQHNLIKPYLSLQTKEEKERFRNEHPEIEEVLKIVNEIDENNIHPYIKNARAIKEWIDKSGDTKPPSAESKDEKERCLGEALVRIRSKLIKQYTGLQTEEEKEKFRTEHPEIDEVLEIVTEIDTNNISSYLRNARKIKIWIKNSGDIKPPNRKSNDEEERYLGTALDRIRNNLIGTYIKLQTEKEKEQYVEQHPELYDVMEIISEIDNQYVSRSKKQQELAILIRKDLEKRKALQEAKKLEQDYEQQLSIKRGEISENTQKQGVDYDE